MSASPIDLSVMETYMISGYHYSPVRIPSGELVTSCQHTQNCFNLVWGLYKQVADELKIALPREYGYAYLMQRESLHIREDEDGWNLHAVEAPESSVISGNLNYSVCVTMAELGAFVNRSIAILEERIANRNRQVREQALRYFTKLNNPYDIELISDQWIIL